MACFLLLGVRQIRLHVCKRAERNVLLFGNLVKPSSHGSGSLFVSDHQARLMNAKRIAVIKTNEVPLGILWRLARGWLENRSFLFPARFEIRSNERKNVNSGFGLHLSLQDRAR
jgi:hypothetical protein